MLVAKTLDGSSHIIANHIELGCEKHAVEAEAETLARTVHSAKQLAYIHVVAGRNSQICQVETCRSRRIRLHVYILIIGQHEPISVGPTLGSKLGVEFVAGRLHESGIIPVEKFVAPTVGVHHKTRKFAPLSYGIEIERQRTSARSAKEREHRQYDYREESRHDCFQTDAQN